MTHIINQSYFPSIQIYLNSKYADAYGGLASQKSWCYFNFKEPIVKLPQAYDFLISCNSVEIPLSMPIVNTNNNTIKFVIEYYNADDGTPYPLIHFTIVIPPGNYSAADITKLINDYPIPFDDFFGMYKITASYNSSTNAFTFVCTFTPIGNLLIKSFRIDSTTSNPIFGISGTLTTSTAIETSTSNVLMILTSDVGVDLAGSRAVFVKCVNIHTQAYDSRTKYSGTTLARIPLTQEPLGIVFWDNRTGFKSKCSLKNVSSLEIQIVDEDGNLVDFQSLDWTATLQLDVITQADEYKPDTAFQ